MKAQQAPPAARHVWALAGSTVLLTMAQRTSGGMIEATSHRISRVRTALYHELNRLARSQPTGPTAKAGGRCWIAAPVLSPVLSVVMALPLHQRDALVVPVHEERDGQADRQVDGHDDGDALDRLPGLVDGGIGDRDKVRVADRHRQRAVLRQVQ